MNQIDIINKYIEIKKDILDNIDEVFLRESYYTKKYRGDQWNDVNVSIRGGDSSASVVQIYLKNTTGYIKDELTIRNNDITSTIKSNVLKNSSGSIS